MNETASTTEPQYWMIVGSPEILATTRKLGFKKHGIKARHRKKAAEMRPGDRFIFYVTGAKAFAGIVRVTSTVQESHELIWQSCDADKSAEDYPFRFDIEPEIILTPEHYVDAEPLARQMIYASKWPAANWTLAFQGNVHRIPEHDYTLIRSAVEAAHR